MPCSQMSNMQPHEFASDTGQNLRRSPISQMIVLITELSATEKHSSTVLRVKNVVAIYCCSLCQFCKSSYLPSNLQSVLWGTPCKKSRIITFSISSTVSIDAKYSFSFSAMTLHSQGDSFFTCLCRFPVAFGKEFINGFYAFWKLFSNSFFDLSFIFNLLEFVALFIFFICTQFHFFERCLLELSIFYDSAI